MLATGWQSTESGESGNAKRERCITVPHPGLVEALAAQRGRDRLRDAVALRPTHDPEHRAAAAHVSEYGSCGAFCAPTGCGRVACRTNHAPSRPDPATEGSVRGRACPRFRQARQAAHAGQPSAQRCAIERRGRQSWRSRNNPGASAHPEAKLPYIRDGQDGGVGTRKAAKGAASASRARTAAFGGPNRDVSELRSIL
jgi:hypothetical protein